MDLNPALSSDEEQHIHAHLQRLATSRQVLPTPLMLADVEYDPNDPIDGGGSGFIYRGQFRGRGVCVKVIRTSSHRIEMRQTLSAVVEELILSVRMLASPYSLPVYGFCEAIDEPGHFCIVLPWMEHGDLSRYLEKHPDCFRTPFVSDIVTGLEFLHNSLHVIHCDLKLANVLVQTLSNGDPRAVLTDFGISVLIEAEDGNGKDGFVGSINWMAPELLKMEATPSQETDVWAFGCVIYETLAGQIPFFEYPTAPQLAGAMMRHRIIPQRPTLTGLRQEESDVLWPTALRCWAYNPQERPTSKELTEKIPNSNRYEPSDRLVFPAPGTATDDEENHDSERLEFMSSQTARWPISQHAKIDTDRAFSILRRECRLIRE
ncbi:Serine/threonine-protein kinase HT1 [Leucoagaricus sp. SymC.cos]|nr:Serine/threonine-protein kinase HT1 [Leucoagaricus sp. SymC.cos]